LGVSTIRLITEPRLKAAVTFQDVYMGLSPFEAPATFSMMPYTELAHGVWYPEGGMYSVGNTLMEIARQAGVEFVFDAAVDRIEVRGDCAQGVVLMDGHQYEVNVVVANADLSYVYHRLFPDVDLAEKLARKRFSCSAISFFWGVDKTYRKLGSRSLFQIAVDLILLLGVVVNCEGRIRLELRTPFAYLKDLTDEIRNVNCRECSNWLQSSWGGRIRTFECRIQSPEPYRLATPQFPLHYIKVSAQNKSRIVPS
jgi:hypothetical protein